MSEDIVVVMKRYADAIDKDRGFESGVTDCLRTGADTIEALRGEVEKYKMKAKTATTLLEAEKWARAHVKSVIVGDLEAEIARLKGAQR